MGSGMITNRCICDYEIAQYGPYDSDCPNLQGQYVRCNEEQVCPEHDKCEECADGTVATHVYYWTSPGYSKLCAAHYKAWVPVNDVRM